MRFLNKLFDSFNEENLKYCILRNYEKLPYNIGNDLDLLVQDSHKTDAFMILESTGKHYDYKLVNKINRYGYLGLTYTDLDKKNKIKIDLITKSLKQWFEYADSNYILQNRTKYKNFYIAPFGSVLYTILLKDILTYGELRKKNYYLIKLMSEDIRAVFIKTGKGFIDKRVLENLFKVSISGRNVSRINLYFRLLLSSSIINLFIFIYYRIKDFIANIFYWKWVTNN